MAPSISETPKLEAGGRTFTVKELLEMQSERDTAASPSKTPSLRVRGRRYSISELLEMQSGCDIPDSRSGTSAFDDGEEQQNGVLSDQDDFDLAFSPHTNSASANHRSSGPLIDLLTGPDDPYPSPSHARVEANMDRIINLQCGERKFITFKSTLTRQSEAFRRTMIEGHEELAVLEDGSYFLDMDPDVFAHVLRFLRLGVYPILYDVKRGHDLGMYNAIVSVCLKLPPA